MTASTPTAPDQSSDPAGNRGHPIRWIALFTATGVAVGAAAISGIGRGPSAPVEPGQRVALKPTYQAHDISGDAINIFELPGAKGNISEGPKSPVFAGIGVQFTQDIVNPDNTTAILVAFVDDKSIRSSVTAAEVKIGNKTHRMTPSETGDGLVFELDCRDVENSRNLPVSITAELSNEAVVTAEAKIDSRSIDSAGRSCTPDARSLS